MALAIALWDSLDEVSRSQALPWEQVQSPIRPALRTARCRQLLSDLQ